VSSGIYLFFLRFELSKSASIACNGCTKPAFSGKSTIRETGCAFYCLMVRLCEIREFKVK
jgi:hypothetical protein